MLLIIFSDNDINDKDTLDLIKIVAILKRTRAFAGLTPVCRARHQKRQPCIVSLHLLSLKIINLILNDLHLISHKSDLKS